WNKARDAQAAAAAKNPLLSRLARSVTIGASVTLGMLFRIVPGGRGASNALFGTAAVTAERGHNARMNAALAWRQARHDTGDAVRANAESAHSRAEAINAKEEAEKTRRKAN